MQKHLVKHHLKKPKYIPIGHNGHHDYFECTNCKSLLKDAEIPKHLYENYKEKSNS